MKKVINKQDIRKANNLERCRMIIKIINRQVKYTKDTKNIKEIKRYEEYRKLPKYKIF